MQKNIISVFLLINFTIIIFSPIGFSQENLEWWNDQWSYRDQLIVPIDTSIEESKYQPIDTSFKFENLCWAKSEYEHSVRVIIQDGETFDELESQIYDLNYSDESHIKSCNIVFLIPKETSGNEQYFVYYDDGEKPATNYDDHVRVDESYYNIEPIPGYPFESLYYKITQGDYIIYAVTQDGKFMGSGVSQQVTKLKSQSTDVLPKSGELFASFDFMYFYGEELEDYSGSVDNLISKEIFIDGNLMVKFGIVSGSTKEDIRTTVTYKYYYCPMDDKRIYAHVKHEILDGFTVAPVTEVEGTYASFQCGGLESNSIGELNFGKIYPYFHVYSEKNSIEEYALNPDPEIAMGPGTWASTMFINTEDDLDLGSNAWISYDEGEKGVAHGLILGSNNVVKSGTDERDGIQVKGREQDASDLPGLEGNMIYTEFSRNSYERGSSRDVDVPKDLVVEYDAEFFSTETGGYKVVEKESVLFQSLVRIWPLNIEEVQGQDYGETRHSLSAVVHLAPSAPFGNSFSILTGMNLSYISAELYQNKELISTGIGGRLPINPLPDFEDTRPLQKIKLALGIFDWKNRSLFKKITFNNLATGEYLIKIFRENPRFSKERRFIGFAIIDLNQDKKIHIFCKQERSIKLTIKDQNEIGVENAELCLVKDNVTISRGFSNSEGQFILKAPCNIFSKYDLNVYYNGFIILNEPIRLGYTNKIIPIKKSIDIQRYDLEVEVLDKWELPTEFDIDMIIESPEMIRLKSISSNRLSSNKYLFSNIIPTNYQLILQYKSFVKEEKIDIVDDKNICIVFPVEFNTKINVFDSRGLQLKDANIFFERKNKNINIITDENGYSQILLPPGAYITTVQVDEELVGERQINIAGERSYELITKNEPLFPNIVLLLSFLLTIIGAIFAVKKRNLTSFLKILAVSLAITSIVAPWWVLHGSLNQIETTTKMYLIPSELITITSGPNTIAGELASLPELVVLVMTLVGLSIAVGCIFLILHLLVKSYKKRIYSTLLITFSGLSFMGSLTIFSYAMAELAKIGVGGFFGEGDVDISLYVEGARTSIMCNWGPDIGFYLCLASIIILLSIFILDIKKIYIKISKNIHRIIKNRNIVGYIKKIMPLIGILILIYLIIDIGTNEIVSTFMKISPIFVIIAVSLTLPRVLIRNYGWQVILKKQNINVCYLKSLKIFLIGYFYGSVTPGYIGQLMRIPYLKDETNQPVGKLFVNSFIEEAVHTLSLYFMVIIGAFLVIDRIPEALPFAILFLIITIIIYFYFMKKERGEKTLHFLIKYLIPKNFKKYFIGFVDTFYNDFPNVRDLIYPFIVVIPTWIIIYSQIYIIGISLDIDVPYFAFLMLYPIANIVAFIPITSAGLGTREATLIFLFSFFGVSPEKTLVLSLAGHLLTDVLTGFYGFIISLTETKEKKKDLSALEEIL